jgi:hypothetical protein
MSTKNRFSTTSFFAAAGLVAASLSVGCTVEGASPAESVGESSAALVPKNPGPMPGKAYNIPVSCENLNGMSLPPVITTTPDGKTCTETTVYKNCRNTDTFGCVCDTETTRVCK